MTLRPFNKVQGRPEEFEGRQAQAVRGSEEPSGSQRGHVEDFG